MRLQSNSVSGTLLAGVTDSATTMTLTGLSAFFDIAITASDDHYIPITLDPAAEGNGPEIIHVTDVDTDAATPDDAVTCVRGREGTTAVSHSTSVSWVHAPTVADYNPPVNPRTPSDEDDEFIRPTLDAKWTLAEPSGDEATLTPGRGQLSVKGPGSLAASEYGAMVQSMGSWSTGTTVETAFRMCHGGNGSGSYNPVGVIFSSSASHGSGGQISFNMAINSSTGAATAAFRRWNNFNAYSTQQAQTIVTSDLFSMAYIRVSYVSANTWRAEYSVDGREWIRASGMTGDWSNTMTPTHFGVWWSNYGSGLQMMHTFDHFRVYATV